MKSITTFSDAYNALSDNHPAKKAYEMLTSFELSKDVLAYLKLRIIVEAFNGRKRTTSGCYYEAHYRFEGDEMLTMFPRISSNRLLGYVNQRDALYAANTFKDLYRDYYLG